MVLDYAKVRTQLNFDILPSGWKGEILANLIFLTCKAQSAGVAKATASICNAAGRKKKESKFHLAITREV
jgi:hypothetical protein